MKKCLGHSNIRGHGLQPDITGNMQFGSAEWMLQGCM